MTHTITINSNFSVQVTIENGWVSGKVNYHGTSRNFLYDSIEDAISSTNIIPLENYLKSI